MTDNLSITQGSGTTVAADNIGSVYHQRTKMTIGGHGIAPSDALRAVINASSSGNNTLVAAVTSKVIMPLGIVLTASSAVNAKFTDSTPTDLTGLLYLDAKGGFSAQDWNNGLFATAAGQSLILNLSGAFACGGWLWYVTF